MATKSDGRCPVGFLEVEEKGEILGGNYEDHTTCTAMVTGSGDIMTARHCINDKNGKLADPDNIVVYFKNNTEDAEQEEFGIRRILGSKKEQEMDYVFLEAHDKHRLIDHYAAFYLETTIPDEILRSDADLSAELYQFDEKAKLHIDLIKLKNGKVYRGVVASSPYAGGDALVELLRGTFLDLQYLAFAHDRLKGPKREAVSRQNYGAPIVYKGRAIGIVIDGDSRNPVADDESGKIQWFPGVFEAQ